MGGFIGLLLNAFLFFQLSKETFSTDAMCLQLSSIPYEASFASKPRTRDALKSSMLPSRGLH
jgi:hypothetical protein